MTNAGTLNSIFRLFSPLLRINTTVSSIIQTLNLVIQNQLFLRMTSNLSKRKGRHAGRNTWWRNIKILIHRDLRSKWMMTSQHLIIESSWKVIKTLILNKICRSNKLLRSSILRLIDNHHSNKRNETPQRKYYEKDRTSKSLRRIYCEVRLKTEQNRMKNKKSLRKNFMTVCLKLQGYMKGKQNDFILHEDQQWSINTY